LGRVFQEVYGSEELRMIALDLIGKKCGPIPFEYTWKDVVVYALSIGAQTEELPFIYENAEGGLKVFPASSRSWVMRYLVNCSRM